MNWRALLVVPLAAVILGKPVIPPRLKPPLPKLESLDCEHASPIALYLQAYAYARESPSVSLRLLSAAEWEVLRCKGDPSALLSRIDELRGSLLP